MAKIVKKDKDGKKVKANKKVAIICGRKAKEDLIVAAAAKKNVGVFLYRKALKASAYKEKLAGYDKIIAITVAMDHANIDSAKEAAKALRKEVLMCNNNGIDALMALIAA